MRNGRIETWKINSWFTELAATPMWLGLCSQDPSAVDDPLTVEVGGSVYRRPQATWEMAGPVLLRNTLPLTWNGLLPGTRVACVVGWTEIFNGRPIVVMPLLVPKDLPAGGSMSLASGELYIGADV